MKFKRSRLKSEPTATATLSLKTWLSCWQTLLSKRLKSKNMTKGTNKWLKKLALWWSRQPC